MAKSVDVVAEVVKEATDGTRARLLTEGASLFRENGFDATTTREISARLGINKASLYYHVTSKEGLLHDICMESLRRTKLALREALAAQPDRKQWIPTLIHAHVVSMLTDFEMHATMLFEMRRLTGDHYVSVKASRDEYEALVLETVAASQEVGALRADLTPRQLTLGLLNLLNWTLSWWSPGRGGLTPDKLADLLTDMYLNGGLPR